MILQEILQKLAADGNPKLWDSDRAAVEAGVLLNTLSGAMLRRPAYLQPGLYIAEINEAGYLGTILFRFK
jgi:hypothetical protein